MHTRKSSNEPDESVYYGIDVNPFVGLRPYEADESFLFFGRDKQISELLQKLYRNRFIGVVGSSGCGKSSLIRAGLIPKLKAGFLTGERDQWIVASMRPGDHSLLNLSKSINEAIVKSGLVDGATDHKMLYQEIRHRGVQAIVDKVKPVLDENPCNMLLLVDQFEELFTIRNKDEKQKNDDITFVNQLLTLCHRKMPFYVIITMRSDYIGRCNKFYGLPEVLNESQYLVPRLNRQQLKDIIELPVRLYGENISSRLVDHLLNDSDKDLDQLPVLQHCLMRTYRAWLQREKKAESEEERIVSYDDYNKAGGLESALSLHANRIYTNLDSGKKKIAELIFRSLTDVNSENEPIRRPQSLGELTGVCSSLVGVTKEEVINVIDEFRKPQCAFLTPYQGEIGDKTMVDISHESLMRQWTDLKEWMDKEQDSSRKFIWLSDSAKNWRELLRGIDLRNALQWQREQSPNNAWAQRYAGNYPQVEDYINRSRRSRRNRRYSQLSLVALFLVLGILSFASIQKRRISGLETRTLKENQEKLSDTIEALGQRLRSENEKVLASQRNDISQEAEFAAMAFYKDSLERSFGELEMALDKSNILYKRLSLTNEYFFSKFSKAQSEAAINLIIAEPDAARSKSMLDAFNLAATAIDTIDSHDALEIAKQAWSLSKNYVLENMLLGIINNRAFYAQNFVQDDDYYYRYPTQFDISKNGTEVIYDDLGLLFTGRINADKIIMDEPFSISKSQSDTPSIRDYGGFDTSYRDIMDLKYTDRGVMAAFTDGEISVDNKVLFSIGELKQVFSCEISNDGKFLVTLPKEAAKSSYYSSEKSVSKIWDLSGSTPRVIKSFEFDSTTIKKAIISPNNKYLLLSTSKGYYDVILKLINLETMKVVNLDFLRNVSAVNFTADSRQIVLWLNTGFLEIMPVSDNPDVNEWNPSTNMATRENYTSYYYAPKAISLSSDQKRLLVEFESYTVLYEKGGEPFFTRTRKTSQVSARKLVMGSSYYKTQIGARFIDDNTVLALSTRGDLCVWPLYSTFTDINTAFNTIRIPDLAFREKLRRGLISFSELQQNASVSELKQAVNYYYEKSYALDTAMIIYEILINKDPANATTYQEEIDYLKKELDLTQRPSKKIPELLRNGSIPELASAADFYYYDYDSPASLDTATMLLEKLLEKDPENGFNYTTKLIVCYETIAPEKRPLDKLLSVVKKDVAYMEERGLYNITDSIGLSQQLGRLSWYQVLNKDFEDGKATAQRALLLDSNQRWIRMNLAHAHLLTGEVEKAKSLYNSIKGEYLKYIIEDFHWLVKLGFIAEGNQPIYDQVCEVMKMLNSTCDELFRKEEEE